jgi:hypothetical protein
MIEKASQPRIETKTLKNSRTKQATKSKREHDTRAHQRDTCNNSRIAAVPSLYYNT